MPADGAARRPVLVVAGPVGPADLPRLIARLDELVSPQGCHPALVVSCDVAAVDPVDIGTIDVLARLHLHARRRDIQLELRRAGPQLRELLELAGLVAGPGSGHDGGLALAEERGQAEEREEALGIQEVSHPHDPSA